MALLFRLNVISKRLTSRHHSFTRPFLPQLHRPQRNLFTNSYIVYFAKKKVDEVKTTPKCSDFEQYFTKAKKKDGETVGNYEVQLDRKSDDKRKPLIQLPTFGDKFKPSRQQLPIAVSKDKESVAPPPNTKGGSNFPMKVPAIKEEKKSEASPDKINPQRKPQSLDNEYTSTKPLNGFTQFALMSRTLITKNIRFDSQQQEKKEIPTSSQSEAIDDGKGKEKSSVAYVHQTDRTNSKRNINYVWLTGTAAAVGAISLALLAKKSSSDVAPENIIGNQIVCGETEHTESEGPLMIPKKVPYLIIGGGTASWSAFRAIKSHVPNAKVLVVSNEIYPPYTRPPLSKMWSIGTDIHHLEDIYLEPSDFYSDPKRFINDANGGISILANRAAKYLKLCERKVVLTDGTEIEYDECLLATGSAPRNLVIFQTAPLRIRNKISFFRNLNDFLYIKEIVDKSESIAVIGGGYLASEVSLALAVYAANTNKTKIYQIFHENGNMGKTLPSYLSEWIKKKLTACGLFVISNNQVDHVQMENSKLKLTLLSGQMVVVDHVIVALGSQPDLRFAKMSALKLAKGNGGIAVNDQLEALPHLYVAGDAACLPGHCGKETEKSYDYATASGRLAGENMVGQKKSFDHLSMFSSILGSDISLESVGVIDSALKTVGVFTNGSKLTSDPSNIDNANKGVVFYIKSDIVVGILLWNIQNKIDIARQVIGERTRLYDLNEVVKRFKIQE